MILLPSCVTTKFKEVPVETIKKEYITNIKFDSIYIRDSIDRTVNGDTVTIYKEHTKFIKSLSHDTIVETDSIPYSVYITKEVEVNHIKWYQKILMWLGGILSLILIIYITYKIKK